MCRKVITPGWFIIFNGDGLKFGRLSEVVNVVLVVPHSNTDEGTLALHGLTCHIDVDGGEGSERHGSNVLHTHS